MVRSLKNSMTPRRRNVQIPPLRKDSSRTAGQRRSRSGALDRQIQPMQKRRREQAHVDREPREELGEGTPAGFILKILKCGRKLLSKLAEQMEIAAPGHQPDIVTWMTNGLSSIIDADPEVIKSKIEEVRHTPLHFTHNHQPPHRPYTCACCMSARMFFVGRLCARVCGINTCVCCCCLRQDSKTITYPHLVFDTVAKNWASW